MPGPNGPGSIPPPVGRGASPPRGRPLCEGPPPCVGSTDARGVCKTDAPPLPPFGGEGGAPRGGTAQHSPLPLRGRGPCFHVPSPPSPSPAAGSAGGRETDPLDGPLPLRGRGPARGGRRWAAPRRGAALGPSHAVGGASAMSQSGDIGGAAAPRIVAAAVVAQHPEEAALWGRSHQQEGGGGCNVECANMKSKMNRIHKLTKNKIQKAGRNNHGRITVFHRGGGNKKLYRIIDYKRSLFDVPGIIKKLEADPNRTSKIALVCYKNGMLSYIVAPKNLFLGDQIVACRAGLPARHAIGNASPVGLLPTGTIVHNVELKPGGGGKLMRAAGTNAKIIFGSTWGAPPLGGARPSTLTPSGREKKGQNVIIRLHSGKLYSIGTQSMATIGIVSNELYNNTKMKKAGEAR